MGKFLLELASTVIFLENILRSRMSVSCLFYFLQRNSNVAMAFFTNFFH
jgi:hypothetical protein